MKTRLQKSIEYIKGYCDKHDDCKKCKLYDSETAWCGIRDKVPEDWKYKTESEGKNDNSIMDNCNL